MKTKGLITEPCLLLLFSITLVQGVKTFVQCDGTAVRHRFDHVFSLDVMLNNASVAHLVEEGVQKEGGPGRVSLSNVSGSLSSTSVYLEGSVDINCENDHVSCEINGFNSESSDFLKLRFPPTLEFDVGVTERVVRKQTIQPSQEVFLTCSVTVGSNKTRLYWRSSLPEGNNTQVLPEVKAHCSYPSNCLVRVTIHLLYDPREDEDGRFFQCMYGYFEVGSLFVEINDKGDFPTHLFLSTVLVYLHFVIMPVVCSCFKKWKLVKNYRDPANERMRMYRGSISLLAAVVFIIWWIGVIYSYGKEFDCYFYFFLIEGILLILYGIIRLLSHKLEKPGDRHLYNGRVALSCGAVITPAVCWTMIKVQQSIPYCHLEGFWWCVTVASILAFLNVSHDREFKAWEKVP